MDYSDLSTMALPASEASRQHLQRLPGATQQMSVFRLHSACEFEGSCSKVSDLSCGLYCARGDAKNRSAAVRAVADRTRRPPWQPISCAMLCSGRLHPPRCNVSHRATLPRPTYHFGDHASLRDSLCNNPTDRFCCGLPVQHLKAASNHSRLPAIVRETRPMRNPGHVRRAD